MHRAGTARAQYGLRRDIVVHHYVGKKGSKIYFKDILMKPHLWLYHKRATVCCNQFFRSLPVFSYPEDIIEIIAPVNLREYLKVRDGSIVEVEVIK